MLHWITWTPRQLWMVVTLLAVSQLVGRAELPWVGYPVLFITGYLVGANWGDGEEEAG